MENTEYDYPTAIAKINEKIAYYEFIASMVTNNWEKARAYGIITQLENLIQHFELTIKFGKEARMGNLTETQLELLMTEAIVHGHIENQKPIGTSIFADKKKKP